MANYDDDDDGDEDDSPPKKKRVYDDYEEEDEEDPPKKVAPKLSPPKLSPVEVQENMTKGQAKEVLREYDYCTRHFIKMTETAKNKFMCARCFQEEEQATQELIAKAIRVLGGKPQVLGLEVVRTRRKYRESRG